MSLNIEIISPKGILFNDKSHMAVIPTTSGEIGIMSNHESIVTSLTKGEIKLSDDFNKITQKFKVTNGFAKINDNNLLILLD